MQGTHVACCLRSGSKKRTLVGLTRSMPALHSRYIAPTPILQRTEPRCPNHDLGFAQKLGPLGVGATTDVALILPPVNKILGLREAGWLAQTHRDWPYCPTGPGDDSAQMLQRGLSATWARVAASCNCPQSKHAVQVQTLRCPRCDCSPQKIRRRQDHAAVLLKSESRPETSTVAPRNSIRLTRHTAWRSAAAGHRRVETIENPVSQSLFRAGGGERHMRDATTCCRTSAAKVVRFGCNSPCSIALDLRGLVIS